MLPAFWRSKRILLLLALTSLLILLISNTDRQYYSSKVLHKFGVHSIQDRTKPFLTPLPEGCPRRLSDGSKDDFIIPCWTSDIPSDILSQVQIVMKTGSAEREKTETFLKTFGSCIPDVIILSDANYTVGDHQVIDILAELPESYADDNPDWTVYLEQRKILASGKQPERSPEGWKLDRFKFLPMVEKAYELGPHAKWYVFIEADIYYFWDTLFRLLSTFDSRQRHYLGNAVAGSYGRWFAYGGAGAVLSHGLVHDLLKGGKRKVSAMPVYEKMTKDDCCGDAVLAYVMYEELGVRLQSLYPTFAGEEVQWLGIDKTKWCTPLLGLHRVVPDMMRKLWRWERCRPPTDKPVTFAAMLDFVLTPILKGQPQVKWNNGADQVPPLESDVHTSLSACEAACLESATCLQYSYSQNICRLADFVKGGAADDEVVSGWNLAALQKLGYTPDADPAGYCPRAEWLVPFDPNTKVA